MGKDEKKVRHLKKQKIGKLFCPACNEKTVNYKRGSWVFCNKCKRRNMWEDDMKDKLRCFWCGKYGEHDVFVRKNHIIIKCTNCKRATPLARKKKEDD